MSEGGPDSGSAVSLALTPPPAARVVPPSPPGGRGTVAGGEAAESSIHKADPAARRRLLLAAPAGVVVLLGLAWWFHGYLATRPVESVQQMKASTHDVINQFVHALYGSAALLGLLAAYWFRLGRRIDAAPQYPLPQMRLFHDMRIVRGEAKRRQARRARQSAIAAVAGAAVLLCAAVVLPRRIASQHPVLFQEDPLVVKVNGALMELPKSP